MSEKDLDLIERYFRDLLSEEERLAFEKRIESDEELKAEVDFHQDMLVAAQHEGDTALKKMFQQQETKSTNVANETVKIERPPTAKIFSLKKVMALAASVLFMVLSYWFYQQSLLGSPDLFANNFEQYPNVIAPIERGETATTTLEKAFAAYENKRYEEAISSFDQLENSTINFDVLFYKANALLALGKNNTAMQAFEQVVNSKTKFSAQAKWYLALTYLKQNNNVQAKTILEEIIKDKSFNYQKAEELITQL